jgi:hypothetical protein
MKMKKKWVVWLGTAVIATSLAGVAFAAKPIQLVVNGALVKTDVPPKVIDGRTLVPIRAVAEALKADVQWDAHAQTVTVNTQDLASLERQVSLYQNWLAPETPDEAVKTWAEAVKMRNGAVQYAVMTPSLKEKMRPDFEAMGWVTGVSSPWVDSYKITNQNEVSANNWEYELEFYLKTSTGDAGVGERRLDVQKIDGHWYIADLHDAR